MIEFSPDPKYNRTRLLTEPETSRLQRHIDKFTTLLEKERRKGVVLDEEYKRAVQKLRGSKKVKLLPK